MPRERGSAARRHHAAYSTGNAPLQTGEIGIGRWGSACTATGRTYLHLAQHGHANDNPHRLLPYQDTGGAAPVKLCSRGSLNTQNTARTWSAEGGPIRYMPGGSGGMSIAARRNEDSPDGSGGRLVPTAEYGIDATRCHVDSVQSSIARSFKVPTVLASKLTASPAVEIAAGTTRGEFPRGKATEGKGVCALVDSNCTENRAPAL